MCSKCNSVCRPVDETSRRRRLTRSTRSYSSSRRSRPPCPPSSPHSKERAVGRRARRRPRVAEENKNAARGVGWPLSKARGATPPRRDARRRESDDGATRRRAASVLARDTPSPRAICRARRVKKPGGRRVAVGAHGARTKRSWCAVRTTCTTPVRRAPRRASCLCPCQRRRLYRGAIKQTKFPLWCSFSVDVGKPSRSSKTKCKYKLNSHYGAWSKPSQVAQREPAGAKPPGAGARSKHRGLCRRRERA